MSTPTPPPSDPFAGSKILEALVQADDAEQVRPRSTAVGDDQYRPFNTMRGAWICLTCGGLVMDKEAHNRFHVGVRRAIRSANKMNPLG